MAEWISVKDRLPDVKQKVLVYAVGKTDGFYGESEIAVTERYRPWSSWNPESTYVDWVAPYPYFLKDYEITHWMPLPTMPKEVDV